MIALFQILLLLSIVGVFSAFKKILSNSNQQKKDKEKLRKFEEEYPIK